MIDANTNETFMTMSTIVITKHNKIGSRSSSKSKRNTKASNRKRDCIYDWWWITL